jgi:hypothetical protein
MHKFIGLIAFSVTLLLSACSTPSDSNQSNVDLNPAQQQLLDSIQSYQHYIVSNNKLKDLDLIYCLFFSAKSESIKVFLGVAPTLPEVLNKSSSSLQGMYIVNEMNIAVYDSIAPCAKSYYASWTKSPASISRYERNDEEAIPISLPKTMSFEIPNLPALPEK